MGTSPTRTLAKELRRGRESQESPSPVRRSSVREGSRSREQSRPRRLAQLALALAGAMASAQRRRQSWAWTQLEMRALHLKAAGEGIRVPPGNFRALGEWNPPGKALTGVPHGAGRQGVWAWATDHGPWAFNQGPRPIPRPMSRLRPLRACPACPAGPAGLARRGRRSAPACQGRGQRRR